VAPEAIAVVEAIMKEIRRVTVNEIAAHLDMSNGSAQHIVYDFSAGTLIFNKLINI
jgi:predicted transcriptional regulator